jgi:tetratricopeptide (TPR) repeat protein
MKKKLLVKISIGLIALLLLGSFYVNYRVFRSFEDQTILLYEFNSYQNKLPLEIVENFNDQLPNITVTTLPLKMLKARYYMRDSLVEKALTLLYQSKKDNPFLKIADFELAKYHLNKKNIDSAEFYSKNAFKALPRNYLYSRQYFQILTRQKKEKELDMAFKEIKNNFIIDQWRDYMFSKIRINKNSKDELLELLKEAKKNIYDKNQLSTIETILEIGYENLGDLGKIVIDAETFYKQDKFIKAANLYEKAARMNDIEYTHYENAALSFYRGNNFEQAEKLFRYVLTNFNVNNGKSEFYLGLLLYEKGEKEKSCKFWEIANQKGFSGSRKVIETFCK